MAERSPVPTATPANRKNYLTTPYDYNTGSDCKIFFGDVWVDDIIMIQWAVNQSKTPIFGYASQNYDAMARGQIIVEGTLAIAFKETGYLNIIESLIEQERNSAIKTNKYNSAGGQKIKFTPGVVNPELISKVDVNYNALGEVGLIKQSQTIEQILDDKKSSLSGKVSANLKVGTENSDFESLAEALADTIWGDNNGNPISAGAKLKRADEFDYHPSNGGIISAREKQYSQVLNILITFGDINNPIAEHTLVALNDVHFTGTSMIISAAGDPIAEQYTFIARDINDSIVSNFTARISPVKLNIGNDVNLSKLSDVNNMEKFLDKDKNNMFFTIKNSFNPDAGWNNYEAPNGQQTIPFNINTNKVDSFVDQVIISVEDIMNNSPDFVNTDNTQYIVSISSPDNDITMVLQQSIPRTRTYKVISPARSGFSSITLTRDDLYPASEMMPPIGSPGATTQMAQRAVKINADKELSTKEYSGVTTEGLHPPADVLTQSSSDKNFVPNWERQDITADTYGTQLDNTESARQEAGQPTGGVPAGNAGVIIQAMSTSTFNASPTVQDTLFNDSPTQQETNKETPQEVHLDVHNVETQSAIDHYNNPNESIDYKKLNIPAVDVAGYYIDPITGKEVDTGCASAIIGGTVIAKNSTPNEKGYTSMTIKNSAGTFSFKHLTEAYTSTLEVGKTVIKQGDLIPYVSEAGHLHIQQDKGTLTADQFSQLPITAVNAIYWNKDRNSGKMLPSTPTEIEASIWNVNNSNQEFDPEGD